MNKRQKNKFFTYNFFPKNRKALSAVVIMVIMVALVMAVMAIVFTMTKKTVQENIEKTEACGINLLDKLSINREYVCYDETSNRTVFSINRGDIDLDKLIVAIELKTEIIKYPLADNWNFTEEDEPLFEYNGTSKAEINDLIDLPPKKGGKTYIATNITEQVISIQIAPVVNGEQCEVVDSLSQISDCSETAIL